MSTPLTDPMDAGPSGGGTGTGTATDLHDREATDPTTAQHHGGVAPVHGDEHANHPSDSKYIVIALVLALITAVEVALYYVQDAVGVLNTPLLVIFAAAKFFIVAAYFMHLKFDNRTFRRLFVMGVVLAAVIYTMTLLSMGVGIGR